VILFLSLISEYIGSLWLSFHFLVCCCFYWTYARNWKLREGGKVITFRLFHLSGGEMGLLQIGGRDGEDGMLGSWAGSEPIVTLTPINTLNQPQSVP
jgi:hypothetical protein